MAQRMAEALGARNDTGLTAKKIERRTTPFKKVLRNTLFASAAACAALSFSALSVAAAQSAASTTTTTTQPVSIPGVTSSSSWNLSGWTVSNGAWVVKPTLTVDGTNYTYATPAQYIEALQILQNAGVVENKTGIGLWISALEATQIKITSGTASPMPTTTNTQQIRTNPEVCARITSSANLQKIERSIVPSSDSVLEEKLGGDIIPIPSPNPPYAYTVRISSGQTQKAWVDVYSAYFNVNNPSGYTADIVVTAGSRNLFGVNIKEEGSVTLNGLTCQMNYQYSSDDNWIDVIPRDWRQVLWIIGSCIFIYSVSWVPFIPTPPGPWGPGNC